jgi:hypothetical protein
MRSYGDIPEDHIKLKEAQKLRKPDLVNLKTGSFLALLVPGYGASKRANILILSLISSTETIQAKFTQNTRKIITIYLINFV